MAVRRNTKQRQIVLDAVRTNNYHLSADQIYLEARKLEPKISRGTVYRNLHLLVDENEIQQVKVFDVDRYDFNLDPHYHLLCTTCGEICDLEIDYQTQLDSQVNGYQGYKIKRHRTIFEGTCPRCAQND